MLGSDDSILVVGGGGAAFSFISTYRDAGGDRPVVMLSADDRLPYFRPAVSKEFLTGAQRADEIGLADEAWFADHGVDVLLNCCVSAVNPGSRTADTTHGPVRWNDCVVATGSNPGGLPVPGAEDDAVLTVRSARDTEELLRRLEGGGSVIVVGSGFIGCEVAAGLAGRGVEVTMISDEPLPQLRRLGDAVGEVIAAQLRNVGVRLALDATVQAIDHGGGTAAVRLEHRAPIEADLVLLAVGARPRVDLLEPLAIVEDGAVPVDSSMATSVERLWAIGDIANAWNERAGRRLRVEHWGDAEGHGRVLGDRLAGGQATWHDVPGFWSMIADTTLKYVAWGDGHDTVSVHRSGGGTTVWYGRGGIVVGVLTDDHDEDHEVAERAVTERWPVPSAT